jgi:pimeloyl-ACP methyl ester carboxylesterase
MLIYLKKLINYLKLTPLLHVAFDSGGKNKPTIVLLHGIAATSKTWDPLIKELDIVANRVIAVDLLGFGESPKPIDCNYGIDDHIVYLRKTLRKLKIKKPYKLVGHSMGAIIAAHYSNIYRGDVRHQYLLSLPLYTKESSMHSGISRTQMDVYLNAYKFLADQKNFTILNSQRLRRLLRISDGIDVNENNWNSFRLSLMNTIISQRTYRDIKYNDTPTNIIFGTLDEFLVQASVKRLSMFKHVKIIRLNSVDHLLSVKFAKTVACNVMSDD